MIISRTPLRISFFGGGTDYPAWYDEHGGSVLATTFDKYSYISARYLPPFFEHKHRIVYSLIENVKTFDEIKHPAVRAVFEFMRPDRGIEIHYDGDLPARSGLGTSSCFTVGLLNALYAISGKYSSKEKLAKEAIHVEQDLIKEHVGSQDQICAAYGGFNRIDFHQGGDFTVSPVIVPKKRLDNLQEHLYLVFTGFSRIASNIAKTQIENFDKKVDHLKKMGSYVDDAIEILSDPRRDMLAFGELLHENWMLKRELSEKVTTPAVDEIYEVARNAGAIGGKLLGAGGGGFMLLFVSPEKRHDLKMALKPFVHVPVQFENSGSRIVIYQPNGL